MRIHGIDAAEGDCLLIESEGEFALIDGGIVGTYDHRLLPHLHDMLGDHGRLGAVIVSHIDADHITGVLDLLADIERSRADQAGDPVAIKDIWHNSFGSTLETANGALFANLQAMMSRAGRASVAAASGSAAFLGIAQGARLQRLATKLGIPLNGAFGGHRITQEGTRGVEWQLGRSSFGVAGPTEANLRELQQDWINWIERNLDAFERGDRQAMTNADKSVPNLSSIVLFGSTPNGNVLLTGDARGDHILQGLEQSGRIAPGGSLPLRLLKVQHHGSDRNVARNFFERLPADIYLLSANGKYGNPDPAVLSMIVDVAHEAARKPLIVLTNETPSLDQVRQRKPPKQYGYELVVRQATKHAVTIDLATGTAS